MYSYKHYYCLHEIAIFLGSQKQFCKLCDVGTQRAKTSMCHQFKIKYQKARNKVVSMFYDVQIKDVLRS